jgi:hypothetical protein
MSRKITEMLSLYLIRLRVTAIYLLTLFLICRFSSEIIYSKLLTLLNTISLQRNTGWAFKQLFLTTHGVNTVVVDQRRVRGTFE